MTNLSPAAQAVLTASAKAHCFREWDHVNDPPCHPDDADWNGCYQCVSREGVAAALRAAADQVVPERLEVHRDEAERIDAEVRSDIRMDFLAIADELEGLSDD